MDDTLRDDMMAVLTALYGTTTIVDGLARFRADNGGFPGPGLFEYYKASGAAGSTLVDAERDYWLTLRLGGPSASYLLAESNDFLTTEAADRLILE